MKFKIEENNKERLDAFLTNNTEFSRSKLTKLIKDGQVLVNGAKVKPGYALKENDEIEINYEEEEIKAVAEDLNLDIVYEDEDVIVVNKPNGMVVHPAVGNPKGTLVNGLLYHSKNLSSINGEFRPGIVHRIDAFTTGLLMVAKNDNAHIKLAKQLEEKSTYRVYYALVEGIINNETGTIDAPIGRDVKDRKKMAVTEENSKNAVTHFRVIERFKRATLIELKLETGRTHQIRVHMKYIGHPVVNDPVYGNKKMIFDESGQCLHAKELGFVHPTTNEYMSFNSELPECFTNIMEMLKNE
ncbi:MAG: RluA family pseudouridine synthase [Bacilli bacterium]|jgi:23S rRNA pseudouridine1911/1915/1917 synthase|nr:RluA family pseudouridine synthase [Bacilli bacterium]